MVNLEIDPFLNDLNKLFERNKSKGTVYVTLKRSNLKNTRSRNDNSAAEYRCLVRATDGKKKKISTKLTAKDYSRFQTAYATILRAHADALKRRGKSKDPKKRKDNPNALKATT